jgi:hypothetical protein
MNTKSNVKFIYESSTYLPEYEKVIINIFNIVSDIIELPKEIEVVFKTLGDYVHGSTKLDYRFLNRITLNDRLFLKDILFVFIHELLHVNQTHVGKLKVDNYGNFFWNGKMYKNIEDMSYNEYIKLPWEADVHSRQRKVLDETLTKFLESVDKSKNV